VNPQRRFAIKRLFCFYAPEKKGDSAMKFKLGLAASVCGMLFALPIIGWAQETEDTGNAIFNGKPIEISTDFAVYSKYIWRGFKLDNDPVAQSGVYLDAYGFNASIWGSLDMAGRDESQSDEVDYSVSYTYGLAEHFKIPASFTGGYIYYNFPAAKSNSQEFFLGVSLDTILSPSFTWFHDFENEAKGGGKGDYLLLEISHSMPISDMPVSFDLSAHAGYNNKLFIDGKGGDIGLGAGLTFTLTQNCTLSPAVKYSIPLGDLSKADDGNQKKEFYGGAVLAIGF
jgi:hypothetical protein